jgi:hypothetical protein
VSVKRLDELLILAAEARFIPAIQNDRSCIVKRISIQSSTRTNARDDHARHRHRQPERTLL